MITILFCGRLDHDLKNTVQSIRSKLKSTDNLGDYPTLDQGFKFANNQLNLNTPIIMFCSIKSELDLTNFKKNLRSLMDQHDDNLWKVYCLNGAKINSEQENTLYELGLTDLLFPPFNIKGLLHKIDFCRKNFQINTSRQRKTHLETTQSPMKIESGKTFVNISKNPTGNSYEEKLNLLIQRYKQSFNNPYFIKNVSNTKFLHELISNLNPSVLPGLLSIQNQEEFIQKINSLTLVDKDKKNEQPIGKTENKLPIDGIPKSNVPKTTGFHLIKDLAREINPEEFVPIQDATVIESICREIAKSNSPITVWTKNQEYLAQYAVKEYHHFGNFFHFHSNPKIFHDKIFCNDDTKVNLYVRFPVSRGKIYYFIRDIALKKFFQDNNLPIQEPFYRMQARKHPRVNVDKFKITALISDESGNESPVIVSCVGGNGLMISNINNNYLLKKPELNVKIEHEDLNVTGKARVAWRDEITLNNTKIQRLGLEFFNLSQKSRINLECFIYEQFVLLTKKSA